MRQFSHEHDLIVVTFDPDGDGCTMRFRQEGIAQEVKGPSESAWRPMFEWLAKDICVSLPDVL